MKQQVTFLFVLSCISAVIGFWIFASHSSSSFGYESVLIILKPDAVRQYVEADIYTILTARGHVVLQKEAIYNPPPQELLERHYQEHRGRSFYDSLLEFMKSGPIVVSVWKGPPGSIQVVRDLVGPTDPIKAAPDTIRGKFGTSAQANAIHASDSPKSASREISIWFE